MLFGVVSVLTKIVMNTVTEGHAARLLTSPVAYVLAVVGVVATLIQQSAFRRIAARIGAGDAGARTGGRGSAGSGDPREHLVVTPPTAVVLGIALAAMAAATVALGRDEGLRGGTGGRRRAAGPHDVAAVGRDGP